MGKNRHLTYGTKRGHYLGLALYMLKVYLSAYLFSYCYSTISKVLFFQFYYECDFIVWKEKVISKDKCNYNSKLTDKIKPSFLHIGPSVDERVFSPISTMLVLFHIACAVEVTFPNCRKNT